jgi:hypothetical protein
MPRQRNEKEFIWTFSGTIKEFREALKTLGVTKQSVIEKAMHQTINKANKIKNTPHLTID